MPTHDLMTNFSGERVGHQFVSAEVQQVFAAVQELVRENGFGARLAVLITREPNAGKAEGESDGAVVGLWGRFGRDQETVVSQLLNEIKSIPHKELFRSSISYSGPHELVVSPFPLTAGSALPPRT